MFNEIGVPISDVEISMLPPGQNKPHQQMLAESGVEMSITWAAAGAIASGISGFMGASSARNDARNAAKRQEVAEKTAYVNEVKKNAYASRFSELMIDIHNQRTEEIYDIQLDQYEKQLEFNRDAAYASYAAETFKMNEQMEAAALNRNKMLKELIKVQGAQAARGGTYSKSKERADLINSLTAYGQEQAEFDKQIFSAKAAHSQKMGGITGQHKNMDYTAWTKIAIAPRLQTPAQGAGPDLAGPVAMNMPSGGFFGDALAGASAGINTFASFGPDAKFWHSGN